MASSSTNRAKRNEKKGGSNKRCFLREWCRPVNLQFREESVNLSTGGKNAVTSTLNVSHCTVLSLVPNPEREF
jgi:hypothetical protein